MRMNKLLPLLLLVTSSTTWAAGRRNPLEGQPAIHNRLELRKLRFELTPEFVISTNQDYKHAFGVGANLQFHILTWLAIGVEGAYLFNANTGLEDRVRAALRDAVSQGGLTLGQPTPDQHDQRIMGANAILSGYLTITPISGKFSLFSAGFAYYDFYGSAGVGVMNFKQNCCAFSPQPSSSDNPNPNEEDPQIFGGFKVGGMFGLGAHLFFTDWFGMQLEFRDFYLKANPGGGDVNGDRHLTSADETPQNNLFFGLGFSFLLPPKAKIIP